MLLFHRGDPWIYVRGFLIAHLGKELGDLLNLIAKTPMDQHERHLSHTNHHRFQG